MIKREVLALALAVLIGCSNSDFGKIAYKNGKTIVHLETLGEYPVSIEGIELKDLTDDTIVWSLLAASGQPQIWQLSFSPGHNNALPVSVGGTFSVRVPADNSSFTLDLENKYSLLIKTGQKNLEVEFELR